MTWLTLNEKINFKVCGLHKSLNLADFKSGSLGAKDGQKSSKINAYIYDDYKNYLTETQTHQEAQCPCSLPGLETEWKWNDMDMLSNYFQALSCWL